MTQQAKLSAVLSPAYDASAIGYHVDNNDGTEYAAFTQVNVSLLYSGFWDVDGLVTLPDAGGTIHWGISGTDIASTIFQPSTDSVLTTAHGSGAWTTADVSALATSAEIAALPTAAEIDTALTASHGSGSWVKAVAAAVVAACASTWSIWTSGRA